MKAYIKLAAVAFALAAPLAGPASANNLNAVESRGIDLGAVAGGAYYTVEPNGLHVVATCAQREKGAPPIRFQAVLAPGQAVTFSSPRGPGRPAVEVSMTRHDDAITVAETAVVD